MTDSILEPITFAVRSVDEETREFTGIAVPWGETANVRDVKTGKRVKEQFERGAPQLADGATLYLDHGHLEGKLPIGRMLSAEDTEDGWEVRGRVSRTRDGEDVYQLMRDGALMGLSVGFRDDTKKTRKDGDVEVRTHADVVEVSVTMRGAYASARVSEVRSEQHNHHTEEHTRMTETVTPITEADLTEVRTSVEDLERRAFSAIAEAGTGTTERLETRFRNGAELVAAMATRSITDEDVEILNRAYEGATTGDLGESQVPQWIQREIRLVQENRPVLDWFDKAPLPKEGNVIEYPEIDTATGTVAQQVNEGDDLPYMEIKLKAGSDSVKTYGGYSRLTRQLVERSSQPYVATMRRYQALQYAKATNLVVVARLMAAAGGQVADPLEAYEPKEVIKMALRVAGLLEDNAFGVQLKGFLAASDVFEELATIVDGNGRPVFSVNGDGQNSIGSVSVARRRVNIAGYEVVENRRLALGTLKAASSDALTVHESPGAPYLLQDSNIINLTEDYSLYGYMAVAKNNAKGIVTIAAPAPAQG